MDVIAHDEPPEMAEPRRAVAQSSLRKVWGRTKCVRVFKPDAEHRREETPNMEDIVIRGISVDVKCEAHGRGRAR